MIKHAHEVGNNIMKSLNTPAKERKWLGDQNMGTVKEKFIKYKDINFPIIEIDRQ